MAAGHVQERGFSLGYALFKAIIPGLYSDRLWIIDITILQSMNLNSPSPGRGIKTIDSCGSGANREIGCLYVIFGR